MGFNMELKGGETKVVNSLGQLKLLLWKNFIQKKRSPISTIIEIFSPLALFLVLVFIRSGQPSNPVPTEYNQAVPLPSAGFIPVLQYFCPEVSSDSQGFPDYPYARVSEFLNFISVTLSSNEEYMDLQNVQSQLSMVSAMMEEEDASDDMFSYFEDIPATGTGMSFEESFMDMDGPSIDMPLSAPTAIDPMLKLIQSYNKIQSELPWLNRLSEQLDFASSENDACRGHFNTTTEEKLDYSDEDYISLGTNSNFKLPKQPTILLLNLWNTFQSVFCGVNNTLNETILEQPDWINEIGFTELQRSKFQQVALLLFKGHPEILYTPNTTEVNTVMAKAAESVRAVTSLTESSMALFNISTQIIALLENRNMQEFYLFLQQSQNNTLNLEPGLESEPPIILPDISSLQQTVESLQKVTCLWNSVMADVDLNFFVPVEDETAMARYFNDADKSNNVTVVAGVVFETNDDGGLPSHVVYKLKLNRTYAPWILSTQDKVWRQSHQHPEPITDMLFPWLQDVIDRAIIKSKTGKLLVEPGGYIREFPNPCHLEDDFLHKGGPPVTILLPILWLFYIISFTHAVVYEKEQRLKEMMKIMGLSSFIHWLSWFLTGLIQVFITVTLLVFVLKYGKLFTFVSPTLLWVFSMSFSVAVVLFCLLVSACFSNAKLGAACACMIHLLFNVPFYYIQNLDILYGTVVTPVVKVLSCMMPPSAYGLGLRYMLYYEFQAIGLQWSNLSSPWPAFYNDITVLQVMLILLIDCAIFVLLTWYVEAVNPGSYGVPQPWYFPFMKSYWCKGHHAGRKGSKWKKRTPFHPNVKEFRLMDKYISHGANGTLLLERRPIGHGVGVHIKDLTKVYKKGKVLAVDGLNLELYTGQITALLGRNGAGKTTVMSILTGFIPPTKGTVLVYGKDIRRQMSLIRQSLGMSPQHDALFDKLTVEEHLWFYSQLKGVSTTNFKTERKKLLTDIGLIEKRHNTINTLSGGMKRKLSVAIAFTGGSKTVILDEPTAGVDPHARRAIWDLLLKYKKGRTILLSTHHMDEASLLGDRIAIISNGYLKFCGSPQYLKNNLGDGYRLTVVKDLNRNVSSSGTMQNGYQPLLSHTSSLRITHFIQEFFPSAKLTSENENELQYLIPLKNTQKSSFIDLFKAMSSRQDKLDISSYAMTEATLEQIFLRVTQEQSDSPKAGKTTANGHVHENGFKSTQTNAHVLEVPANSDGEVHRAEQNNHNTNKWTDGTKKEKCQL
ncbi:ATP-binding cassette sub-family A member 2-like isoform X1 [Ptychodera flava]|uniref:ATP-binding cassette sub-family A member 2-like isoform X1 n=1 Tax=Ptychodera flava TaxID=63121 RepID=UPI00396A11F2